MQIDPLESLRDLRWDVHGCPRGVQLVHELQKGASCLKLPLTHRRRHRRRAYHEPHQPKGSTSMYCPECGNDAGSAKFCPECGADLAGVKDALSGKTGAAKAAKQGGGAAPAKTAAAEGGPKRLSPAVIWGGFGALAVIVIIIVVMVSGGFGGGSGEDAAANASGAPAQAVNRRHERQLRGARLPRQRPLRPGRRRVPEPGIRSGRRVLRRRRQGLCRGVEEAGDRADRRHGLRGRPVLQRRHPRRHDQIDAVLKANPDFQKGWLNKGIFLSHEGRISRAERRQEGRQEAPGRGEDRVHQGRRHRPQVRGRQAGRPEPAAAQQ